MAHITIKYLGGCVDTSSNGFFNALGKQSLRSEYINKLQNNIKDINSIDKIVATLKKITDDKKALTPKTVFLVDIDDKKYFLSNQFQVIPKDEFEKLDFVPNIKFDKNNCDIQRELISINEKLRYKTSSEAIKFIEDYISHLPKSYKYISDKPNKIFLYHTYNKEMKEFEINTISI